MTPEQIQQMIAEVDKDGSGTIDLDEFIHMMTDKMGARDARDELHKAFRIIDQDANVRTLLTKRLDLRYVVAISVSLLIQSSIRPQGKISDMDVQRLAIEAGEHFTLDEVREMIQAADENGPCTADCTAHLSELQFSTFPTV